MTDIRWQPHPGPQTYALAVHGIRELFYGGARGGGKTDAGMVWLAKPPHIHNPRYRALIVRRNSEDLSDWLDRAALMYQGHAIVTGKPPVVKWKNGPIFRTGHLKDKNAYTKYVGQEYHKVLFEELTLIPDELRYMTLISCCRSTDLQMPAQVFCTANPGGVGHAWCKDRWGMGKIGTMRCQPNKAYQISEKDTRLKMYIPATVEDNPSILLGDPGYIAFLDSLPEPFHTAWRIGDWDIFMGQVFAFSADDHIISPRPVPEDAPMIMTYDYGFGAPYHVGWLWMDPDGRLYLCAELYGMMPGQFNVGIRQTDMQVAELIKEKEAEEGWKGRRMLRLGGHDSWNKQPNRQGGGQGPSTAETWASMGITLTKADSNRVQKIRQFHERLRVPRDKSGKKIDEPMLKVYDTCIDFIRTVPMLQADEHNPEDIDTDLEDHPYDSIAQACMARPLAVKLASHQTDDRKTQRGIG